MFNGTETSLLIKNFRKSYESRKYIKPEDEVLGKGEIDWEKSKVDYEHNLILTEVKMEGIRAKKFIIGTYNSVKAINNIGHIIIVDKNQDTADYAKITSDFIFGESSGLKTFSGSIIQYDLTYTIIKSKNYDNGNPLAGNCKITRKGKESNKGFEANRAPLPDCEGGVWITTDWWLITYDENGLIIGVDYLGTTTYCSGGSGNGGGGGGSGGEGPDYDSLAEGVLVAQIFNSEIVQQVKEIGFSSLTITGVPIQWVVVKNKFNLWKVTSSDIVEGYNSKNTGAIIYNILHSGSSISGQLTWNRIPRKTGVPIIPLISLSWQETSHSKTIASDYRSGTITVSGNLKNFGISIKSPTNSCTINAINVL